MGESERRCSAARPSRAGQAAAVGWRDAKPFLFLREAWRRLPPILPENFAGCLRALSEGWPESGKSGQATQGGLCELLGAAAMRRGARSAAPPGVGPRVGVASAEEPAPRAVAWGWRGGTRRWAGRGNWEERAGRVCSCPCLALGRGRAGARAGGKAAGAAVVGFDWRGGEVTCERLRPPRPDRAGPAGPHAPCEAGVSGSRQSPRRESATRRRRTLGAAARAGPGRCRGARDAPGGGGLGTGKRKFAGVCPPRARAGRGAGRCWRGRRRPTPCWGLWETGRSGGSPLGRRSGWNRLGPAAPVRRTPPRGPGQGPGPAAGDWTSRRPRSCGAPGLGSPDRAVLKLCRVRAPGARCDSSSLFYVTLCENGTAQIGSDRSGIWRVSVFLSFMIFCLVFKKKIVIKGRELVPRVARVDMYIN